MRNKYIAVLQQRKTVRKAVKKQAQIFKCKENASAQDIVRADEGIIAGRERVKGGAVKQRSTLLIKDTEKKKREEGLKESDKLSPPGKNE